MITLVMNDQRQQIPYSTDTVTGQIEHYLVKARQIAEKQRQLRAQKAQLFRRLDALEAQLKALRKSSR